MLLHAGEEMPDDASISLASVPLTLCIHTIYFTDHIIYSRPNACNVQSADLPSESPSRGEVRPGFDEGMSNPDDEEYTRAGQQAAGG